MFVYFKFDVFHCLKDIPIQIHELEIIQVTHMNILLTFTDS